MRGQTSRRSRPGLLAETLEDRALLATTILVTNTDDSGAGSLRQAIEDANQSQDEARIEFAIPDTDAGFVDVDNALAVPGTDADADVFRISLLSGLPAIQNVNGQAVTLDATTQTAFTGDTNPNGPEVELDGDLTTDSNGLVVLSANAGVHGLVINRFDRAGIVIEFEADQALITANYIGTDASGTMDFGNGGSGIEAFDVEGLVVGGAAVGEQNLISGNGGGIYLVRMANVTIQGNRIGTDVTGTLDLGNNHRGIHANVSSDVSIRDNLISGNNDEGIFVESNNGLDHGFTVTGNFIGTNAAGTAAIPNGHRGIQMFGVDEVTIGGSLASERNVISGNGADGAFFNDVNQIDIIGNYVGTDVTGAVALANGRHGIWLNVCNDVQISGNVVGANSIGVVVEAFSHIGEASQNVAITGNFLGTDLTGTIAIPNRDYGLYVSGVDDVTIGGALAEDRNVISGNLREGVYLNSSSRVSIVGNRIGTDITGTLALGNSGTGVYSRSSNDVLVKDNVLSSNHHGVNADAYSETGELAQNITIIGNFIGTDVTGLVRMANREDGVNVQGMRGVTIGGSQAGEGNVISGNSRTGVFVNNATGIHVVGNKIGTDITGLVALANAGDGISMNTTSNAEIIGNVLAANPGRGIIAQSSNSLGVQPRGLSITGNFIGTDATGTVAMANGHEGIFVRGVDDVTIGGSQTGEGNVVSGNLRTGVFVEAADGVEIIGNRVGTDITGTLPLANGDQAVFMNLVSDVLVRGNVISASVRRGLWIRAAAGHAQRNHDVTIAGNFIGTDVTGTVALGNAESGIAVESVDNLMIGGSQSADRNVIADNGSHGIEVHASNHVVVVGNAIGTDVTGSTPLGNGIDGLYMNVVSDVHVRSNVIAENGRHGIGVDSNSSNGSASHDLVFGGLVAGEGNVISGNNSYGIVVTDRASNVDFFRNRIGTNVAGTAANGNGQSGIGVFGSEHIRIGAPGAGNVVSDNDRGIYGERNTDVTIQGNRIGTDISGTIDLGNRSHGIDLSFEFHDVLIGGAAVGAGNVISGNGGTGVIFGSATNVVISGNRIGTNLAGTAALANGESGLALFGSTQVQIGMPGSGNVISGNLSRGLFGENNSDLTIAGNRIGTDTSGTVAIGNASHGIDLFILEDATIGGTAANAGNVISSNGEFGIVLGGAANVGIQGNRIGTDITGVSDRGNGLAGVLVTGNSDVRIGGVAAGAGNTVAFNGTDGVAVTDNAQRVRISGNALHSNGDLGIDLDDNGVTMNDDVDEDSDDGTNRQQNFPVIAAATLAGQQLTVGFFVPTSDSNAAYPLSVEFFTADADPDAPEGRTFLGSVSFTAADFVAGTKTATFTVQGSVGATIVSTATDADGNTSEFSAAKAIDLTVTLPTTGGPFKVLKIGNQLHVRRANSTEAIAPQPLVNLASLRIIGSTANDDVTLDASLNGFLRAVRFEGNAGADKLNAQLMNFAVTMDGGAGNDSLLGGSAGDSFVGGTDNDNAQGFGGADTLLGGLGNDILAGGEGADSLNGEAGIDQVDGGAGDADSVTGGLGNDILNGGTGIGDVLLETFSGSITMTSAQLTGALGTDRISGLERAVLTGGVGHDTVNAAGATIPLTIDGGEGNDSLKAGSGNDVLLGGGGDDSLTGNTGNDDLRGDAGTDRLIEVANVNLGLGLASLTGLGTDIFTGIESAQLSGGTGANRLEVTDFNGSVTLLGLGASDTLIGGSSADSLDGGEGSDTLTGNGGDDRLTGGGGTVDVLAESGATAFVLSNTALTGRGSDILSGVERARLTTANTDSSIDARSFTGGTTLTGGGGNDTILGGSGADSILGGAGDDVLRGNVGNDSIFGQAGDDILLGDAGADSLSGSSSLATNDASADGDDTILGGAGTDRLFGGLGNDILSGEADNDTLTGDGGTDSLFGGAGSDSLAPGLPPDTLSADGLFNDAAFTANLNALLAAFP